MSQIYDKNDKSYLESEVENYKTQRDHFLELSLNLQTKLEKMKRLEVDLRHEIYQLKNKNLHFNGDNNFHSSPKNVDQHNDCSFNDLYDELKDIRELLQDYLSYDHKLMISNNLFQVLNDQKLVKKELLLDMNEKNNDQEQNNEEQKDYEAIIKSQAKDIAALKQELDDMKKLLNNQTQEPTEAEQTTPSKTFTFRDIQNAKEIYSKPAHNRTMSHVKRTFDHDLQNDHFQSRDEKLFFNNYMKSSEARVVNIVKQNNEAKIIDHTTSNDSDHYVNEKTTYESMNNPLNHEYLPTENETTATSNREENSHTLEETIVNEETGDDQDSHRRLDQQANKHEDSLANRNDDYHQQIEEKVQNEQELKSDEEKEVNFHSSRMQDQHLQETLEAEKQHKGVTQGQFEKSENKKSFFKSLWDKMN